MNQVKYLAYAFLLILLFASGASVIEKLLSTALNSKKPAVSDFVQPNAKGVTINAEGKTVFQGNCQTCHAFDKNLTGPALRGVESRGPWTDRKNLLMWVKNPAGTINKFQYTKDLVVQYGGQIMPSFPQLTDTQIENIFDYITNYPPQGSTPIAAR